MSEDVLRGQTYTKTAKPYLATGEAYLFLADEKTEYQGLHIRTNHTMYKVLDAISFDEPIRKVHAEPTWLHCYTDTNKIKIQLQKGRLVIQPTHPCNVTIDADCRPQKEHPTFGRNYTIDNVQKGNTIKYFQDNELQISFDIHHDGVSLKEEWIERNYSYDEKRTGHGKKYVFRLGTFEIENSLEVFWDGAMPLYHHRLHQFLYTEGRERLCAGYPWFSQSWARDEVISVEPLIRRGETHRAKRILLSYVSTHNVSSVVGGELKSADVYGWLARRLIQLDKKTRLSAKTSKEVYEYFTGYTDTYVDETGLVPNGPLETWMDTSGNTSDTREGYSVEIQFGLLAVYQLLTRLARRANKPRKEEVLSRTKGVIRHMLVDKGILHDGYTNGLRSATRPNVFLAWYLYPRGVHRNTWLKTFEHVLNHCWCLWGGLSSIGKDHPLYQHTYTGQDNKSYHRGDSWYFVNNIAAIAMDTVGKNTFLKYTHKIRDASLRDWEEIGAIGACSEISSASSQDFSGTFSQAWSLSTLDELLHRLR